MKGITMVMEETVMVSPDNLEILQEMKSDDNSEDRVKFKVPLQDAEIVNGNRRFYSNKTCTSIVEALKPMAKNRCLFQEINNIVSLYSNV